MLTPLPLRITEFLSKLALFSKTGADNSCAVPLVEDDETFGVYSNGAGHPTCEILISNAGIQVQFEDHWQSALYSEIKDISLFTWDKKELSDTANRKVVIELKNGDEMTLLLVGAKGASLDVSNFHNFLLAAVQTRQVESRRVIRKPI